MEVVSTYEGTDSIQALLVGPASPGSQPSDRHTLSSWDARDLTPAAVVMAAEDACKHRVQLCHGVAQPGRTLVTMTVRPSGVRQHSVWASVVSDDPQALRSWLLALGFTEDLLVHGEDGDAIHHCQLDWPEGGRVLLSGTGERPTPCRPGTSSLHVVTATPDAVMARARDLEARIVHEIVDQTDYPSRDFTVADPDGNHWTFATFAG